MTITSTQHGHCLCNAVQLTATVLPHSVSACHCTMCRRWTGGPLMVFDCGTEVSFKGQEHIGLYRSSDWADRGFCQRCGSHLFFLYRQTGQYFVPAGLFDMEAPVSLDLQVFIDDKPAYYNFAEQTENLTAAEVFALYAPTAE